jgi:hypothetical protein
MDGQVDRFADKTKQGRVGKPTLTGTLSARRSLKMPEFQRNTHSGHEVRHPVLTDSADSRAFRAAGFLQYGRSVPSAAQRGFCRVRRKPPPEPVFVNQLNWGQGEVHVRAEPPTAVGADTGAAPLMSRPLEELAAAEQAVRQQVAGEPPRVVSTTAVVGTIPIVSTIAVAIVPTAGAVIPVVPEAGPVTIPAVVPRVVSNLGNRRTIGRRISHGRNRQGGQRNCDKRTGDCDASQPPAWSSRLCRREHHGSFLSCGEPCVHHPSVRVCSRGAQCLPGRSGSRCGR